MKHKSFGQRTFDSQHRMQTSKRSFPWRAWEQYRIKMQLMFDSKQVFYYFSSIAKRNNWRAVCGTVGSGGYDAIDSHPPVVLFYVHIVLPRNMTFGCAECRRLPGIFHEKFSLLHIRHVDCTTSTPEPSRRCWHHPATEFQVRIPFHEERKSTCIDSRISVCVGSFYGSTGALRMFGRCSPVPLRSHTVCPDRCIDHHRK